MRSRCLIRQRCTASNSNVCLSSAAQSLRVNHPSSWTTRPNNVLLYRAQRPFTTSNSCSASRRRSRNIVLADDPTAFHPPFRWTNTASGFADNIPANALLLNPSAAENNGEKFSSSSSLQTLRKLSFAETPVHALEKELIYRSLHLNTSPSPIHLLHHLLYDRRVRPNSHHYEALLLMNASPTHGSASNVRSILQEMDRHSISANVHIYTACLKALAIHPDTELVCSIISTCEKQWIDLDREMLHLIATCYIRADMPEIAMDYFDQLTTISASNADGRVDLWLYIVFLRHLSERGDWDAVLRMLYKLNDDPSLGIPFAQRQMDIPYSFWAWLLGRAVEAREKDVTFWIFKSWVLKGYINPSPELFARIFKIAIEARNLFVAQSIRNIVVKTGLKLPSSSSFPTIASKNLAPRPTEQNQDPVIYLSHQEINHAIDQIHDRSNPLISSRRLRTLGSHFFAFRDEAGLADRQSDAGHDDIAPARIDAWTGLTQDTDPGRGWPRILEERRKRARIVKWTERQFRSKEYERLARRSGNGPTREG